MKKTIRICASILLILAFSSIQAQDAKLTVKYSFTGIEEGYDHTTKTKVFIDGTELCSGEEHKQSKPNSFVCQVTPGTHNVRIMNYAYYEGTWEEHTIENNYSIDCLFEKEMDFKKKKKYTIELLFDIDSGTIVKGKK